MKLDTTLPERPGLLHAIPVLDLFALLWLLVLLGPLLLQQSGVAVDLPPSRFHLDRFQDTLVVTLGPTTDNVQIHLGRDAVTLKDLSERLETLRSEGAPAKTIVLLQSDVGTSVGMEREITELVLGKGFRMALVGSNSPAARLATPTPDEE